MSVGSLRFHRLDAVALHSGLCPLQSTVSQLRGIHTKWQLALQSKDASGNDGQDSQASAARPPFLSNHAARWPAVASCDACRWPPHQSLASPIGGSGEMHFQVNVVLQFETQMTTNPLAKSRQAQSHFASGF